MFLRPDFFMKCVQKELGGLLRSISILLVARTVRMASIGLVREREVLFDTDWAGLQDQAIECFGMHPTFLLEINLLDGFVVTLSQELHRVN